MQRSINYESIVAKHYGCKRARHCGLIANAVKRIEIIPVCNMNCALRSLRGRLTDELIECVTVRWRYCESSSHWVVSPSKKPIALPASQSLPRLQFTWIHGCWSACLEDSLLLGSNTIVLHNKSYSKDKAAYGAWRRYPGKQVVNKICSRTVPLWRNIAYTLQ